MPVSYFRVYLKCKLAGTQFTSEAHSYCDDMSAKATARKSIFKHKPIKYLFSVLLSLWKIQGFAITVEDGIPRL